MFSRKALVRLIVPLVMEQFLAITIGLVNTVMVSGSGEAAVSGVSLVDSINVLMINIFGSLAAGGAIVTAQCLGSGDKPKSNEAARQLLVVVGILAVIISGIALIFSDGILMLVFGKIDADVMSNCRIYFFWTALSYLPLGLYNAGAALFRAMGNSKISMTVSIVMNIINFLGNFVLIKLLNWGVLGAAVPALVSRICSAAMILFLLYKSHGAIRLTSLRGFKFNKSLIKSILAMGIPNGIENSVFQFGKILVQGIVVRFGTAAIAANAVANSLVGLAQIPSNAIGMSMITVVGQCVGAKEYKQAKSYCLKLTGVSYIAVTILSAVLLGFSQPLLSIYNVSAEAAEIVKQLLIIFGIGSVLVWPAAFTLPSGLRAAGDVRYTMTVSILSMWLCRVALGYLLAQYFGMGVTGVWIAMICDWLIRGLFFVPRMLHQKWANKKVI